MNRTGKTTRDIFSRTTAEPSPTPPTHPPAKHDPDIAATATPEGKQPRGPGRPVAHQESWKKVTTVLFNRQIVFLDRLGADIREQSGKSMSRAEIIRALIDALEGSGLDITGVRSEDELKNLILSRLGTIA